MLVVTQNTNLAIVVAVDDLENQPMRLRWSLLVVAVPAVEKDLAGQLVSDGTVDSYSGGPQEGGRL